jgi:ABC-type transport system involved in multi-copper enzyme maturation permease subunit
MFGFHGNMYNYLLVWIVVAFLLSIYVVNDAARFEENGMLWGIITFVMPMMGILIYLVVRSTSFSTKTQNNATKTSNSNYEQYRPIKRMSSSLQQNPISTGVGTEKHENDMFDILYCSYCGVKNNVDAAYCHSCGTQIIPIPK